MRFKIYKMSVLGVGASALALMGIVAATAQQPPAGRPNRPSDAKAALSQKSSLRRIENSPWIFSERRAPRASRSPTQLSTAQSSL